MFTRVSWSLRSGIISQSKYSKLQFLFSDWLIVTGSSDLEMLINVSHLNIIVKLSVYITYKAKYRVTISGMKTYCITQGMSQ